MPTLKKTATAAFPLWAPAVFARVRGIHSLCKTIGFLCSSEMITLDSSSFRKFWNLRIPQNDSRFYRFWCFSRYALRFLSVTTVRTGASFPLRMEPFYAWGRDEGCAISGAVFPSAKREKGLEISGKDRYPMKIVGIGKSLGRFVGKISPKGGFVLDFPQG